MPRDPRLYLDDILEAIDNIMNFWLTLTLSNFRRIRKLNMRHSGVWKLSEKHRAAC